MKIVVAPDSFKGSLSSGRVCFFIEKGLKKAIPEVEIIKIPIADGGEGSLKCLKASLKADYKSLKVVNPIGKKINSFYLVSNDLAVIEMAQASGITLINDNQKNPFKTTSYGTGQLILHAIKNGIKNIYLCIGGSATVDGGAGMLQALGIHFYDKKNNLIKEYMNNELLKEVKKINTSHFYKNTHEIKITLLSDVKNKLLGKNGAVYTYANQKGAKCEDLPLLESNMKYFYNLISRYAKNVINIEGTGAAGGLGAGVLSFFDCEIKSGIDEILELINFSEKTKNANIIITGEGSIDKQTINGKLISGILNKSNRVPVIAIAGSVNDIEKINKMGLLSAFSICNKPMSIEDSIINVEKLIENISIQIGHLIKLKF